MAVVNFTQLRPYEGINQLGIVVILQIVILKTSSEVVIKTGDSHEALLNF